MNYADVFSVLECCLERRQILDAPRAVHHVYNISAETVIVYKIFDLFLQCAAIFKVDNETNSFIKQSYASYVLKCQSITSDCQRLPTQVHDHHIPFKNFEQYQLSFRLTENGYLNTICVVI